MRTRCMFWICNNAAKHFCLLAWACINALTFYLTFEHYRNEPEYHYLHTLLGSGLCISRAAANVINLNACVLLLPVSRGVLSLVRRVIARTVPGHCVRILLDHYKGFHILCATTLVIASVCHVIGHTLNAKYFSEYYDSRMPTLNAAAYSNQNPLLIVLQSAPGVTGLVLFVLLSLLVSSSVAYIREAQRELFSWVHRLAALFYVTLVLHALQGILKQQINVEQHAPGCIFMTRNGSSVGHQNVPVAEPSLKHSFFEPDVFAEPMPLPDVLHCSANPEFDIIGSSTWLWVSIPLAVYLTDFVYRLVISHSHPAKVVGAVFHPGKVVQLYIYKPGFSCNPGQYVLLQLPMASMFEWHPYTVTEVKNDTLRIYLKAVGDWSEKVYHSMRDKDHNDKRKASMPVEVYLDRTFESPLQDVLKYPVALCVAAGVGITPFLAVLNLLRCKENIRHLQRLYIIWITRDYCNYQFCSDVIEKTFSFLWSVNMLDVLEMQFYLTKFDKHMDNKTSFSSYMAARTFYGRPHLNKILSRIANNHPGCTLGLFGCGPTRFLQELKAVSTKGHSALHVIHHYSESF